MAKFDFSKIKVDKPDRLRFGTAGMPLIASGNGLKTHQGVAKVRELGLEAMELEFVHSVNLTPDSAMLVMKQERKMILHYLATAHTILI